MRSTITISLPKKVRMELDRVSRLEGVSRSDIVRESVQDYLFLRRFRTLRKTMVAKASRRGIHTDQDVFDRVS
jgi:metal-responsive CopG/Arc/MetJ family transcriptional regulator